MDVDATQLDPKKAALMKTGSCFKCEHQGHLAKDCPNKNKSNNPFVNNSSIETKKYKAKEAKMAIKAIYSNLESGEEEAFDKEMKDF